MSDTASMSSANESSPDDIVVVDDELTMPSESDIQDVLNSFSTSVTLDPDLDISPTDDLSLNSSCVDKDSDSLGASSNGASGGVPEIEEDLTTPTNKSSETNGTSEAFYFGTDQITPQPSEEGKDGTKRKLSRKGSKDSSQKEVKKSRSPLEMLKKLTKFSKPKKQYPSEFSQVRIDRLPQVFVVKYLGKREIKGLYGLHHVRKPVDELMSKLKKSLEAKEKVELPLVYVVVSPKGIDIREHKLNKVEDVAPYGNVAIDFISYGVQDIKYWRIFVYIVVNELSSRTKQTELHAVLCDSALNARRMALSLGGAFKLYSKNLSTEGKAHNFQVELRPPDELAEAYVKECDA
ncbi:uncharacterized protein LOC126821463 [Patella vulgata]|uniref:uncharacterized protein LOC126821463 n=1 Tax=Patella vulgata TaxID=6465 RepID=UPI00217F3497|nr:uncharacterized protein LOC126821463 [Patella vulgata]XP_050405863.1 uncharacterized protein LOC126821463 [Patella vulgata]